MASINPSNGKQITKPASGTRESNILQGLVTVAGEAAKAQFEAFAVRLADALISFCEVSGDAKEASASFNAANILKKNSYVLFFLFSTRIEESLKQAIAATEFPEFVIHEKTDDVLSLVPYEEMDKTLLLGSVSRPFDTEHEYQLNALGRRITHLLGRNELSLSQNPFRPAIFLNAFNEAWAEFDPDEKSHALILPLLRPDVFLELSPILTALNADLIARGVMPDMSETYRIKKSNTAQESTKSSDDPIDDATLDQLKRIFSAKGNTSDNKHAPSSPYRGDPLAAALQEHVIQATAASNQLLGYLAGVQKTMFDHHQTSSHSSSEQPNASILANIKNQAPHGALSQIDETTIDLLTKIFEVVFHDPNIPTEIKALIGFLQVPVLKAALIDKDFFFKHEHPARKLIDVLTKSSLNWDQSKGQDDPLYQTIKHNVKRVQAEFDQQIDVFSDVVSDLESFISEDDAVSEEALAQPITHALRQEKMGQATKAAKTDVSLRVGTGEVVAFVETFLEDKWVSVLTLAYSIKDEKPEALESAVKTMDDLVWSVKPKITMPERKELIAKLPTMLAMLNKWLNIVKLDDTERLQFFAELAECHASIVRAPLEISPQRQLEIAMEAAKKAAERRREKQIEEQPAPIPDASEETVQKLQRGTWVEFVQEDGTTKKVKLAWVSPLRSLYIFSTSDKVESFSLSAEEFALNLRDKRAEVVMVSGLVDRALVKAMQEVGANDPMMDTQTAA